MSTVLTHAPPQPAPIPDAATPRPRGIRGRRVALTVVLWLFSLTTSLLLVGAWGRGVTGDTEALSEAGAALVQSDLVRERVAVWIADAFDSVEPAAGALLPDVAGLALNRPEVEAALSGLAADVVSALAAPPGTEVTVDVGRHLRPAVEAVASQLAAAGLVSDVEAVVAELDRLSPVVFDTGPPESDGGPLVRARSSLTVVVVSAIGAMALLAGVALLLTDDRVLMVRTLATRVALSALSFTVMLRVGAWALDPRGGRAPVRQSISVLLGSSQGWPLAIGMGALSAAALVAVVVAARRKPAAR